MAEGVAQATLLTAKATSTVSTLSKVASVASKTGRVLADFTPIVGGALDIKEALNSGSWLQVGLGVGSIALDVFTLGGSSLAKGAVKTGVKEGAKLLAKEGVEQVTKKAAAKGGVNAVEQVAVHGNSLKSLRPTWGYKLYSQDGTFLKNGITSAVKAESRYTRAFMSDKVMLEKTLFPNRAAAYQWEFQQNQILRGPLNLNMH